FQSATGSFPGMVTTAAQTLAGAKTFTNDVTIAPGSTSGQVNLTMGPVASGSGAYVTGKFADATGLYSVSGYRGTGAIRFEVDAAPGSLGSYTFRSGWWNDSSVQQNATYAVVDSAGVTQTGAYATTGGLTFKGGLYVSGTATGGPPSGGAGGDLTGTYPGPTILQSA